MVLKKALLSSLQFLRINNIKLKLLSQLMKKGKEERTLRRISKNKEK
jgi:hypothetical protein